MFKRKSVVDELNDIIDRLRIIDLKLRVARNINEKRKGFDELLFFSSLYGLPISYSMLSNMYVSTSNKDLEKIIKKVNKMIENAVKDNRVYSVILTDNLSRVLAILKEAMGSGVVDYKIELIDRAISTVSMVRDKILMMYPLE